MERIDLAKKRLIKVLEANDVACSRTLEQKISDAGPNPQRIDPHVLTTARRQLEAQGVICQVKREIPWYFLSSIHTSKLEAKLEKLIPVQNAISQQSFTHRLGQTLEISVFRTLLSSQGMNFFGAFNDLDGHTDDHIYSKEEPPCFVSGRMIPQNKRLDFLAISAAGTPAAIEVKNVREWLYPQRDEITDLLLKACAIRAVPVLIARRIPFVTFKLFNAIGGIVHQTYNQRFPASESALAAQAADKHLLGYHDIRVGNEPDARLKKFVLENLPVLIDSSKPRFDEFFDLTEQYATGMPYAEFAARVRRRSQGISEDSDDGELHNTEFLPEE